MYYLQTKKILLELLGGKNGLQTINPENGNGQSCVQREQGGLPEHHSPLRRDKTDVAMAAFRLVVSDVAME